jgi:tetratricopeptide (TPR) repeat protein
MTLQFLFLVGFLASCTVKKQSLTPKAQFIDPLETPQNLSENSDLWTKEKREAFASLYYMIGEYKLLENDPQGAKVQFEESYDMTPNSFVGAKVMTSILEAGESNSDSLLEARRMVLLYPKSEVLRTIYAKLLFSNKMPEKAVLELEKAIELDPLNEKPFLAIIEFLEFSNKKAKALKWAEKFVNAVPNSQLAVFVYARLLIINQMYKKALAVTARGLEFDDTNPQFLGLHGYCLEVNGQTSLAVSTFEEMFRQARPGMDMAKMLIDLYRESIGLERAEVVFDRLSQSVKAPIHSVEIQRAYIKTELKKIDSAVEVLEKASESFPESDLISLLLGVNYLYKQEKVKSTEAFRKIRVDSKYYLPSIELQLIENVDERSARENIKLIESLDGSITLSVKIYGVWAAAYSFLNDNARSVKIIEKAITQDPEEAMYHFLKGVYLEKEGDVSDSIDAMQKAIKLEPNLSSALNFLAYLYAELDRNLPEALSLIKRALAIKPQDPFYLDTLGWVFFKLGKFSEAEEIFEELVKAPQDEIVIFEHLAEVKLKLNKFDEALKIYESVQGRLKKDKDSERIKRRYEKLLRDKK